MTAATLALVGLALWAWRMRPRTGGEVAAAEPLPFVSIVVPARDEERALPRLLTSLAALDYPRYEVIVVDDCSTDRTAAVAAAHGARVVQGAERPPGWGGKQWACTQGAAAASGAVLLFTDADTWHAPHGLTRLVGFLQERGLGMASSLPFHDGTSWWERLTGPFHLMLLAMTAPFATPRGRRVYAIGQYLAFTRPAYDAIGGHAAVRSAWVEDLPLAQAALARGIAYGVWTGAPLFHVRMYETLGAFLRGWRRNFRAGFEMSPRAAPLEAALFIAAATGGGQAFTAPAATAVALATVVFLAVRQKTLGSFSAWGAVLVPFSIALFCLATLLAVYDRVARREQRWKGRTFRPAA